MSLVKIIGEYKGIKDAHSIVKEYSLAGMLEQLKNAWGAHPKLTITYSDEPVSIAPSAMERYFRGAHDKTLMTGNEIGLGYSCSRDGKVIAMIKPIIEGSSGRIDVLAQKLYEGNFRRY